MSEGEYRSEQGPQFTLKNIPKQSHRVRPSVLMITAVDILASLLCAVWYLRSRGVLLLQPPGSVLFVVVKDHVSSVDLPDCQLVVYRREERKERDAGLSSCQLNGIVFICTAGFNSSFF